MFFELRQGIRQWFGRIKSVYQWVRSGYGVPVPHFIKQRTILRYTIPGSVFIETGTYKGSTSRYFRPRGFDVATIEVHEPLYQTYSPYLRKSGIDARLGDSAEVMPKVLFDYRSRDAFTIFLDGHYSEGITGKGHLVVPLVKEFDTLREFVRQNKEKNFSIIIDDVRLFMPNGDPDYPMKSSLLDFASSIGADWTIEHDIFVCHRSNYS